MRTSKESVEISSILNHKNGEVTLFISNIAGGPVVTGKNMEDAKSKMKEAFGVCLAAASFEDGIHAIHAKNSLHDLEVKLKMNDVKLDQKYTC
ncbi:MAG: RNA-binding protein 25 [Bacteroidia bacterium]|jgi:hypothetical protein|nr:RNA-binding protein 25 [Bacteroidia bacterium]